MTTEAAELPEKTAAPSTEKKKRKVGFKTKMALLQVIERKRLSDNVDYKAISARTGVSADSLRQLWMQWSRGQIDMGEPETPEERQIDARVQFERRLGLLNRYEALLLNGFEAVLLQAEDKTTTSGNPLAFKEVGLRDVIRELKTVTEMRRDTEKGYVDILEEMAARTRTEKPLNGAPVPPEVQTQIVSATDEAKALAAIGG